jgi:protein-tyrosine phosphatase
MAEGFLRLALGSSVKVSSAGLDALIGAPPDPEAAKMMREHGCDISGHRGRQFTPDLAYEADLILVMDAEQKEWCTRIAPSTRGRIFLLGHWVSSPPRGIADPSGRGCEAFRRTLEDIQTAVSTWIPHLLSPQGLA